MALDSKKVSSLGDISFDSFIGCKIIKARPMTYFDFLRLTNKKIPNEVNRKGYLVVYPDGYQSWSPCNVFENAYRLILDSEKELIK